MRSRQSGIVTKWVADRGFGFIKPDSGGDDVFLHIKALPLGSEPQEGTRVTYDVTNDARSGRSRAVDVHTRSQ
nr:cold shock domain-containing protein [Bradyrhizobium elkanii]